MKKNILILTVIGIAILSLAAFTSGVVMAQEPVPTEEPEMDDSEEIENSAQFGTPFRRLGGMHRSFWRQTESYLNSIAEAINVDVDILREELNAGNSIYDYLTNEGYSDEEIESILHAAHEAVLQEAVETGVISEEQAEAARERMEQMDLWRENQPAYRELWLSEIASTLDMDVDSLSAALEEGDNIHDLLEEKFGEESALDVMTEAREKVVDQALEDGLITEEQAERINDMPGFGWFNRLRTRFQEWKEGFGSQPGRGARQRWQDGSNCPGWNEESGFSRGGWGRKP